MGSYSPDSSITGPTGVTGLTNPTYTLASDLAPDASSRQHVVTALGGTQTDVRVSTAGDPFTVTMRKYPYRALPPKNPVTGAYGSVPRNKVDLLFRKGMKVDSSGTIQVGDVRVSLSIPAGAESNDAPNIRALLTFMIGVLTEEAVDITDSAVSGVW